MSPFLLFLFLIVPLSAFADTSFSGLGLGLDLEPTTIYNQESKQNEAQLKQNGLFRALTQNHSGEVSCSIC